MRFIIIIIYISEEGNINITLYPYIREDDNEVFDRNTETSTDDDNNKGE